MDIKRAQEVDAEKVFLLVCSAIDTYYSPYYTPAIVRKFHSFQSILSDIKSGKCYVAKGEKGILGTVSVEGAHIRRLFVRSGFQREGTGSALLRFAEKEISKAHPYSELDASIPAEPFYEKRGYSVLEECEEKFGEENIRWKVYRKRLWCEEEIPKAVILDFYGTVVHEAYQLLDRIALAFRAGGAAAGDRDIQEMWWRDFAGVCDLCYGASFRPQKELYADVLTGMAERTNAKVDVAALVSEVIDFSRTSEIFEDSKRFLRECPLPVYILSNIDNEELSIMFKCNAICPVASFTSEQARAYKPRAEIFEKGLASFGLRPAEAVYIGDSLRNDYYGARGAGMRSVWINRTGASVPEDVEFSVPDLYSVLDYIKEWKDAR